MDNIGGCMMKGTKHIKINIPTWVLLIVWIACYIIWRNNSIFNLIIGGLLTVSSIISIKNKTPLVQYEREREYK